MLSVFLSKFIQLGCCKPPAECGFIYRNVTVWIKPKAGAAVKNVDCKRWSNELNTLCYNCDTCKAGMVSNIKYKWKQLAIVNACITVILVVLYSIGCCARRNNSSNKVYGKFKGYKPYPWFLYTVVLGFSFFVCWFVSFSCNKILTIDSLCRCYLCALICRFVSF